ncbi:MAG: asparaginase [Myxococcota bacterium]|nr:asparaginase [Myxococcota bacterium]MDW8364105.1 asparaginase domain-containing protein [Myxococcales bacterium]
MHDEERPRRIALVSTGGTIEKTYDELSGRLTQGVTVLDWILATLDLEGVELTRVRLMNKDSLEMTREDHEAIARTAAELDATHDGVVIVHGTDRLAVTGETLVARGAARRGPIVLTGAMRPYVMRNSDAPQNLTEALLAVQLLPVGVYVAFHNRCLRFPGVVKDPARGTFVRACPPTAPSTGD